MNRDNDNDGGPGLVGIMLFMVIALCSIIASLTVAWWYGRETNALSPHHFSEDADGTVACRFDSSKISVVLTSLFSTSIYVGLAAGYVGILDIGIPETLTPLWWMTVFGPVFLVLSIVTAANRLFNLKALSALVWSRPGKFRLAEPRAIGFLSADDFRLYQLYEKAIPLPADDKAWADLAAAGGQPSDVERWAAARASYGPLSVTLSDTMKTICPTPPTS